MTTATDRTVWQLARLAGCSDPDTNESPGGQFLRLVESTTAEYADGSGGIDWEDVANEIADGCVPVYTYRAWQTFVDLAAWEQDIGELISPETITANAGDLTQTVAMTALYVIGQTLATALLTGEE